MKSELTFLTDLFLSEEVPAPIKKIIALRIRDVEKFLTTQPVVSRGTATTIQMAPTPHGAIPVAQQQPSMQRIMERNPDLIPTTAVPSTPAAAAALAARTALLNNRNKEKPDEGRNGPRKI